MANLLEKASIILTPTAYDDAKVLTVIPDDGSGDFDFSRGSAATRVNAQGLVEDVQILSSNLVQNGDFSEIGSEEVSNGNFSQIGSEEVSNGDFSQEGSELITNGDFSSDTDWTITNSVGTSTNISGGSLNIITDGAYTQAAQNNILTSGKSYVLVYTITSNSVVGSLSIVRGSSSSVVPSTVGTHSFYFESDGGGFAFKRGGGALNISIDNVSCVEVGQDWSLGTGWSIGDDKATFDETIGGAGNLNQGNTLTVGKTYKLTFDTLETNGGNLAYAFGNNSVFINNIQADTTHVVYGVADDVFLKIRGASNFNGSITNISVKEVGQDWVLGGWEISENKVTCDASGGSALTIQQQNVLTSGKTYKITYTILDYVQGVLRFRQSPVSGSYTSGNGEHTVYIVPQSTTFGLQGLNGFIGSVTNISVREVAQNWYFYGESEFTSQGARIYSSTGSYSALNQSNVLTIGNKYKITFDVISTNGTNLASGDGTIIYDTSTTGNKTFYITASEDVFQLKRVTAPSDVTVTNISVLEITDDTNLPRINYSGFTYQDSLGSEEIADGNFTNQAAVDYWSIAQDGGVPRATKSLEDGFMRLTYDSTNGSALVKSGVIPINNRYKVTFRAKGTASAHFASVGNNGDVGTVISNPTLTNDWQNYEFYVDLTSTSFRLYLSSVAIGSTLDITNISVKEYLGQEVVPDSGCGAWLFEPQSTNLIPYSEDFSQWPVINTTILLNNIVSPDGTLNADRITATSTGDSAFVRNTSVTQATSTTYSFSCFVKKGTTNFVRLANRAIGSASTASAWFDIENGVVGTLGSGLSSSKIEDFGNGWYRCIATGNTGSTIPNQLIDIAASTSNATFGASVNDYIFYWGAQFEQQSYATSYIPTEGTIKTRNHDLCTNGGDASLINSTEGVLYAEISALVNDLTKRSIALSNGGSANRVLFRYDNVSNKLRVYVVRGGTIELGLAFVATDILDNLKVAVKYKENDFALWVNGIEVDTNTSGNTPIGLNTLQFANGVNGEFFYGNTKGLKLYNTALTDAQLQTLTTL